MWNGCTLRMAQGTLDHLTSPVITEVWTLRPSKQRLCWMGFLLDVGGTGWHSGPSVSCPITTDRRNAGANPVPGR